MANYTVYNLPIHSARITVTTVCAGMRHWTEEVLCKDVFVCGRGSEEKSINYNYDDYDCHAYNIIQGEYQISLHFTKT